MRIGLQTPSYNSEKWIYPFLKLSDGLLDKRVIVQGREPIKFVHQEHGLAMEPDRSEALIRKEFPDVDIIYQEKAEFGPHFWQQGHDHLKGDVDFILRFDSDEMLLRKDWERLVNWLRELKELGAMGVNFGNAILYTYDLDHGRKNPIDTWIETRGLDSMYKYEGFGYWHGGQAMFDVVVHHLTGFKRGDKDKELIKQSTDWVKCPKEIRDLYEEGLKKLEQL